MQGKERILSFFRSKDLLNAKKIFRRELENPLSLHSKAYSFSQREEEPEKLLSLHSKAYSFSQREEEPKKLLSPRKEAYSFSQGETEVNLNTEEDFNDYSLLKNAPLQVKNKENNLSFNIAYGTPFYVPREQSCPRKLFLVYVVGEIEKAKEDIKRFSCLSWSFIYLIVEAEKSDKYLPLVTLFPNIILIFCKKNKGYYAMGELWNLAHKFHHGLIFYFMGSDILKKGVEEEIFSLLDNRWLEILADFPSVDILAWKANSKGHVWYNAFWVKSSYLRKLKEPPGNKKNFYYMKWLAARISPYSILQTCREKCNLGEYYYS